MFSRVVCTVSVCVFVQGGRVSLCVCLSVCATGSCESVCLCVCVCVCSSGFGV